MSAERRGRQAGSAGLLLFVWEHCLLACRVGLSGLVWGLLRWWWWWWWATGEFIFVEIQNFDSGSWMYQKTVRLILFD